MVYSLVLLFVNIRVIWSKTCVVLFVENIIHLCIDRNIQPKYYCCYCQLKHQQLKLDYACTSLQSDRLFILAVSSRVNSLPSCWISVSPCVSMSSAILWTPSSSLSTLSSLSWNTLLAIFSPNGSLSHLKLPQGVLNVVSRVLAKSKTMCQ